ncbi:hypothetical protein PAA8504_04392 [Palleronia abyssalis]|uniref:Uncharacterized protein n=1 Tax=Palleronia abyssalis TaxID=1501240 RepID=A0A2R8C286_9RHOB|nr:hypothetical protein PAA8504_04392 [Palleronia abyssalis]
MKRTRFTDEQIIHCPAGAWAASRFGNPFSSISQERICQNDKFSHDCGLSNFSWLSCLNEVLELGLGRAVVLDVAERRHEEDLPDRLPASLDMFLTTPLP